MYAVLRTLQVATVTAGTAVPLAASKLTAYGVRIKPLSTNTGLVYLGDSTVDATTGIDFTSTSPALVLDDLLPFGLKGVPVDLSQFYIDSAVNAEGFVVSYLETYEG